MYKHFIFAISAACVLGAFAAPSISNVRISQDASTRTVSVTYDITGEPAVVTLDGVTTNGAAVAEDGLYNVSGAANRLVQAGADNVLRWQPPQTIGFGPFPAGAVSVSLKAWATNAPPDWMVVDLSVTNRVRYYTSSNAIPGGIADIRYKTSYLVMRRIPAAGVTWRMGSPSTEAGASEYRSNEHTHYVKLTEDYYLGMYPVTYRQFYYLNGNANNVHGDQYTAVGGSDDDWPMSGVQHVQLRSWMHEESCKGTCGNYHKYWPVDGHEIDGKDTEKCAYAAYPGKYTPYLRTMRSKYGLEFDLPTDAQWEFACRGGSTAYESRYGNVNDIAWHVFNSSNATYNCCTPHPVGLKKPNGYGLYDMIGNTIEQCLDFYAASDNSDTIAVDPVGPTTTSNTRNANRVWRGCNFDSPVKLCRSAVRKGTICTAVGNTIFSADTHGAVYDKANGFRLWLPTHAAR